MAPVFWCCCQDCTNSCVRSIFQSEHFKNRIDHKILHDEYTFKGQLKLQIQVLNV